METVSNSAAYAYRLGEEVLLRTQGVRAFDLELARPVPEDCLPAWMIGEVAGQRRRGAIEEYVVRVRRHGRRCIVITSGDQIEGTV
jgi:hypothetical protein